MTSYFSFCDNEGSSGKSSNSTTGGFVKWLYPGAPSSPPSSSDKMSSSVATDKSIPGSTPKNVSDDDDNRKEGEVGLSTIKYN